MKYKLHIPYVNRVDLLEDAVKSARDIGHIHTWANGRPFYLLDGVEKHHRLGLMSYTSMMNHFIQFSVDQGDDVMYMMHNDVFLDPGVAARFRDFVELAFITDQEWGVCFSKYDLLCAYNVKAMVATGWWDVMWMMYTSDNDYFHRLKIGGWRQLEAGGEGVHHRYADPAKHEVKQALDRTVDGVHVPNPDTGSSTLRNDPDLARKIKWRTTNDFDGAYYRFKWGDNPGHEVYDKPFGE